MNIEHYQTAIAKAEANLADMQAIVADWSAKEAELIRRDEALRARKAEIAAQLEAHEAAMVDAVGSGEKLPKNNAPDLHAEAAAIDQAHATFPARLAEHRARGTVKDGGVHAARGVLHQAQFDHAIFVYRAAMEPIWPLVDQVRQLSTPRHDMTGMADSNGRFGKLPGQ
jgi:hypothetical protein